MKSIAIIGGNGQVGTEASLFLSLRPDIRVIPISRSEYGSTFLRHCGIECRHGSLRSPEQAKRLLKDCDVVADFSVPHGTAPQIRKTMADNIANAIQNSQDAKQYIYVSSHAVYRHTSKQAHYRLYPRAKLYAERVARRLGREAGKQVYVLRLGMVHGVLPGTSRGYMTNLRDEKRYCHTSVRLWFLCLASRKRCERRQSQRAARNVYSCVESSLELAGSPCLLL